MQAGETACTCAVCEVVCNGRFESCADVWARGPVTLIEAPVRPPSRGAARRREPEAPLPEPVSAPASAPVMAGPARPDAQEALAWLRREFAGIHARLENLSDRVARQEASMAAVAGEQASEMNLTLAELEGCAGELRTEAQHLRDLREAMTEAVPPMVDAAARHAVATTTSGMAAEMHGALAGVTENLPAMIDASMQQAVGAAVEDLRAAVSGIVETSVQQAVSPAVDSLRAVLAHRSTQDQVADGNDLVERLAQTLQRSVSDALNQALAGQPVPRPEAVEAPTGVAPPPAAETSTPPVEPPAVVGQTSPPVPAPDEALAPASALAPEAAEPVALEAPASEAPASEAPASEPPGPESIAPEPIAAEPLPGIAGPAPTADTGPLGPDSSVVFTLPGLCVGPSLAIAVGRALGRARTRRRRLRQAAPPAAGLHRQDPFAGRIAGPLERFALARGDLAHDRQGKPAGAGSEPADQSPLSLVAVGERDGREIALPLDVAGGLSIVGPDALAACRALLTTFLARAEPPSTEVAVVADFLGDAPELPGVARVATLGPVLDRLAPEIARRSQLIADTGVGDVVAYKARYPHELLPLLVVATRDVGDAERLRALAEQASGLGVAFLLADAALPGATTVQLRPGAVVEQVTPSGPLDELAGARLFTMSGAAAAEVLGVIAGARSDHQVRLDGEVGEAPFPVEIALDSTPIQVSLLGSYRIEVGGQEIRSGLRAKARELLAFYLLHPEGTTLDAATEALWPEADAGRGSEWFWTALGNLRSLLRNATGQRELKVIERYGDQYRIEPLFDVDLWRLQKALVRAGMNSADAAWATALQEAADLYRGDLLADADWAWVQVPRDDLRRRAVDVLVSLAASRQVGGDVRGALGALQQAVQVDPLAEQLYRRIMRLYSRLSRPDDVAATFQQLKNRLAEAGLEPTSESTKLSVELCGAN
jgi:DNA-binding SARP family transcriptional activator